VEVNVDTLVGPTHHYGGLGVGNQAADRHRHSVSHPKAAALQGLAKMQVIADAGALQVVLPPQPRPLFDVIERLGISALDEDLSDEARQLVSACSSSASMWTANVATFTPSADAADQRPHVTPANLVSSIHRTLESGMTARMLKRIFPPSTFVHHEPLPASLALRDEGAANHARLTHPAADAGVHLFTFGSHGLVESRQASIETFARQTYEASRAIARLHRLRGDRVVFAQQSSRAVQAGAFHNDLLLASNEDVVFYHPSAWEDAPAVVEDLRGRYELVTGAELCVVRVPEDVLPLHEALRSYVFNSQIVTRPSGNMTVIAPVEAQEWPGAHAALELLLGAERSRVDAVRFVDLTQSMMNGGGPACLRLRMPMTGAEVAEVHPGVLYGTALHDKLVDWVGRHYRDSLATDDLADPALTDEVRTAFAELEEILDLLGVWT
jgi:succinylarginine dihydrolase